MLTIASHLPCKLFQSTTNIEWRKSNQMVTWTLTSRYPNRSNLWPRCA